MRIGLYLGYGPNTVLKKEGLGRYLGTLIKGFSSQNHNVTIACPKWMLSTLDELVDEFRIDKKNLDFITTRKNPAIWIIYEFLKTPKKLRPKKPFQSWLIYRKLYGTAEFMLSLIVSISNIFVFLAMVLLLLVLFLLVLPFLIVVGIVLGVVYYVSRFAKSNKFVRFLINNKNKIAGRFNGIRYRVSKIISVAYDKMVEQTNKKLVRKINKSIASEMDVWYSPAAFWSSFVNIQGITVLNVPDLVTSEFCNKFSESVSYVKADKNIRNTIRKGKFYVTYCDYVKEHVRMDQFGFHESQIRSIPHAVNNLSLNITFDRELSEKFGMEKDYSTEFSRRILNSLWVHNSSMRRYLRQYDFSDTQYIFYSSQVRPHKNFLTMIKAYEHLLRRKYCNVKLVLTGGIESSPELWDYIVSKRLEYDVISFFNLSEQELAAVYRCADLVVNPTLFEGGFPFTFAEGMSVGTPSLMSDIPQVRDVVAQYGLENEMLFDPYDWKALAEKIAYALEHKDELYQKELPMYQDMEKRTTADVIREYIDAFKYFIEQDQKA